MTDRNLLTLAERAGLAVHWQDYRGRDQQVGTEAIQAILAAMQLPAASAEQQRSSLAELEAEREHVPELLVGRCGEAIELPTAVLRQLQAGDGSCRLLTDAGDAVSLRLAGDNGTPRLLAPGNLPGYHQLVLGKQTIEIALAPERACSIAERTGRARAWGLTAQLYGLRRAGDGGIGNYTALNDLIRSFGSYGADALGISPVHAQFSADVDHFSPYSPSSRLFLNALHIDLAADFGTSQLQKWLRELNAEQTWRELERAALIDWRESARLKLRLARLAWDQHRDRLRGDNQLGRDFQHFRKAGGEVLLDHVRFEALHAEQLKISTDRWHWRNWPETLREPRSPAVAKFADAHRDEVDFHCFLQWQAQRGLAAAQAEALQSGMGIGLLTDLAVGTDSGGSHAWSRQHEMLMGLSVGAPPDLLSVSGQNWGLTTFSPRALRLHGYRPFLELLRATLACAGGMRIDHILGICRLWLVPEGAEASAGAYLRYPFKDLLNLIALESWRSGAVVIGEDLGTVPADFRAPLANAGVLGTRVLWFEQEHGLFKDPAAWETNVMATTTTHDLPTVVGWWQGRDLDWRARLELFSDDHPEAQERMKRDADRSALWEACRFAGIIDGPQPAHEDAAPVVQAAIRMVADTPAELALLPLEDVLAEPEQPNLPGTTAGHPNWRRRLSEPAPQLLAGAEPSARLQLMATVRSIDALQRQRTSEPGDTDE